MSNQHLSRFHGAESQTSFVFLDIQEMFLVRNQGVKHVWQDWVVAADRHRTAFLLQLMLQTLHDGSYLLGLSGSTFLTEGGLGYDLQMLLPREGLDRLQAASRIR